MNLMLDIGCCQGGIKASSIEHFLSFKIRGLACYCGEFSKFYKYFHDLLCHVVVQYFPSS